MYKFIHTPDPTNPYDNVTVEMSTDTVGRDDLIEVFEDFLRACGYSLQGRLEVVDETIWLEEDAHEDSDSSSDI